MALLGMFNYTFNMSNESTALPPRRAAFVAALKLGKRTYENR